MTFRIEKLQIERRVIFRLSGRMELRNIGELEDEMRKGKYRIFLDLGELVSVDFDAVRFLEKCEENGIELRNCSGYVRQWINRIRHDQPLE